MNESRLYNSIRNLKVAWIGQFCNIFAKFIMRRFFVQYIASEYLGLDAVYTNIIGLLNLAELGIESAISYALYKPLAEHDDEAVLGIMQLLARVYRIIACFICVIGILIMPFLTIIAPEIRDVRYAYFLFVCYLFNTLVSYLWSYKGILAIADQKKYIYLKNYYIFTVGLNITQIFVIYITRSFIAFAVVQSIFTFAKGISLSATMNRRYPILRRRGKVSLPNGVTRGIESDIRKIVVSKVGNTIISSTDNLILSNVVGLSQTGAYSNYALINISLQAIMCQFQSAISASVGNIVATEEKKKEIDYFWFLNFTTSSLYAFTSVCLYNLIQPFVEYWLGSSFLMSDDIVISIVAIYYVSGIRGLFATFSIAHGAFELDAKKAVAEAVTNLILSIILAEKMGLIGVLLGTILSSVCVGLPLELINVGNALPEISKKRFVKELCIYGFCTILTLKISSRLCSIVSMHLFVRLSMGFVLSIFSFSLVWYIVLGRTDAFKQLVSLIKRLILSKNRH